MIEELETLSDGCKELLATLAETKRMLDADIERQKRRMAELDAIFARIDEHLSTPLKY